MSTDALYLRPNLVAEPLVDRWYAWTHLISPATAARNLTHRHLRIMDSFVDAPQVHAAAVSNPILLGGPFIDYPPERADEIRALRDRTVERRRNVIAFSDAIEELDRTLQSEAQGYSLEPFYSRIPPPLQGYVELVYDLHHHPSVRFLEPLLYRSEYYEPSAQSLALSLLSSDDRPFILSTPRLDEEDVLHLPVPFASPGIDRFFQSASQPQPFEAMADSLGVAEEDRVRFRRLFSNEPPRRHQPPAPGTARWRYFGHACILLETPAVSVLLDPVLSYTYETTTCRYTYEDLPETIDYVLISHNHQDHILIETLLRLRHRVRNLIVPRGGGGSLQDPSLRLTLEQIGFRNVIELDAMDRIPTADGWIMGFPFLGEHGDLDIRTKLGWLVKSREKKLLFAADSRNLCPEMYRHLHRDSGDIDILFLGMECDGAPMSWMYGPLFTQTLPWQKDQSRRLAGSNHAHASELARQFQCREAYVYAMGQEPWLRYVMAKRYQDDSHPIVASNAFVADCRARGMTAERLFGEKEIAL